MLCDAGSPGCEKHWIVVFYVTFIFTTYVIQTVMSNCGKQTQHVYWNRWGLKRSTSSSCIAMDESKQSPTSHQIIKATHQPLLISSSSSGSFYGLWRYLAPCNSSLWGSATCSPCYLWHVPQQQQAKRSGPPDGLQHRHWGPRSPDEIFQGGSQHSQEVRIVTIAHTVLYTTP